MSTVYMDNEGPFARAARSLETVTGGTVDVRTECEELRADNEYLRNVASNASAKYRALRAASLSLLMRLAYAWSPPGFSHVASADELQRAFYITEDELAAEYQRQYDEWVRESESGQ